MVKDEKSGNMDYFKHHSEDSTGSTCNLLFDEFGHLGRSCWWALKECFASHWDGHSEPKVKIHEKNLKDFLRISPKKLQLFLKFLSEKHELSFNISGKIYEIDMPNMAKIKTTRKLTKSISNQQTVYIEKDIEKEIEIDAVNPQDKTGLKMAPDVIQIYNDILGGVGNLEKYPAYFLPPAIHEDFLTLTGDPNFNNIEKWKNYFQSIKTRPSLIGTDPKFNVSTSFLYFLRPVVAMDILSGKYKPVGGPAMPGQDDGYDAWKKDEGAAVC